MVAKLVATRDNIYTVLVSSEWVSSLCVRQFITIFTLKLLMDLTTQLCQLISSLASPGPQTKSITSCRGRTRPTSSGSDTCSLARSRRKRSPCGVNTWVSSCRDQIPCRNLGLHRLTPLHLLARYTRHKPTDAASHGSTWPTAPQSPTSKSRSSPAPVERTWAATELLERSTTRSTRSAVSARQSAASPRVHDRQRPMDWLSPPGTDRDGHRFLE